MPSPLGHVIGGLILHLGTTRSAATARAGDRAVMFAVAAAVPDLDLVFKQLGLAQHQGASHSVTAAALAGLAAYALARWRAPDRAMDLSVAAALGWLSHVVLDYLGRDTHPPIGLLVFWPFSDAYWKSPVSVFRDIGRSFEWEAIVHNTLSVSWELLLLLPLLALLVRRHRLV